jgi:predicted DNA-binding transcriptional regulator AlpA
MGSETCQSDGAVLVTREIGPEAPVETTSPPILVDVKEVSRLTSLSERYVWKLRADGEMPAPIKIGSAVRWRYAEILEWIGGGCRVPTPGAIGSSPLPTDLDAAEVGSIAEDDGEHGGR